jgi:membrane fusion protein (multidrug efflux system)
MRLPIVMLAVVAVIVSIALATAQDSADAPRQPQAPERAKTVEELRQERIAALQQLTEQLTQLYQNARVQIDSLLEARVQLYEAQLDAAQKPSDRHALAKNLVKELKQYEQIAQGRVAAARATTADVLRIKARRLEAEIRLAEANAEQSTENDERAEKSAVATPEVKLARPQVKDVTVRQQYVGQIHARRHIEIRAPQKGYIESISVHEGQAVKKGELVFNILPGVYQAKLDTELADVKIAAQELQNAQRLFKSKVVSQLEVTLRETKLAKAQAEAELAKAELNLTEVRAPFDGIIDRLLERQGSMVLEGETVTTLSDNSSMWVYFNVPEARYLEYLAAAGKEKERKVELVLADGSQFQQSGTIGAIEADFDHQTGTIPFRADFSNPDGLLRHGMTGNVVLHQAFSDALVIPQRATFEVLGKRCVYVVDSEGRAHQREIAIRGELEGAFIVASGIDADDRIVVQGIQRVSDGKKVQYDSQAPEPVPGRQETDKE